MSFKAFISSTAIAGTVITGTMVVSAPAEAATIVGGSTLNLSNTDIIGGGVKRVGNNLDFFSFTNPFTGNTSGQFTGVSASTGSFTNSNITSLIPPLPRIQDLVLVASGPNLFTISGPIANFITGVNLGSAPFSNVNFNLTSFVWNSSTGSADLAGIFVSGSDSIAARGLFTSQLNSVNPSSYSLSITAVPTPALLPGIIGMGVAALRRRREEAEENA
ncbi:PTPA-CTERM sorting domain-containing protein [Nodosilinea sp. FACHB-13]|uniref:PTPA-CTERM sorting domain-containing protein n=1 Tax=Cyanophyceae TaxID=3028117 RepID=UPI0016849119|nr:PTPA-CTERM sorting domain-containing protein [Nodosilinea sp. FACHB-13]MBD2109826.1 PTPA-CTERM sorting domain-containing protein [Nodosilinea sp. FACHB-13]